LSRTVTDDTEDRFVPLPQNRSVNGS